MISGFMNLRYNVETLLILHYQEVLMSHQVTTQLVACMILSLIVEYSNATSNDGNIVVLSSDGSNAVISLFYEVETPD